MADALCGPSNALQGIQKHTSVDRTLQQDRLTARHSPAQEFRSISERNAGILDPEFEAFQAKAPAGIVQYNDNILTYTPSGGQLLQRIPPHDTSHWASDFQDLRIEEARASTTPQIQFEQLNRHLTSGWQHDFARQQNQPPVSQGIINPYHRSFSGLSYQSGPSPWVQSTLHSNAHPNSSIRDTEETFDETAFEQAFEAARVEALQFEAQVQGSAIDHVSKTMAEQMNSLQPTNIGDTASETHRKLNSDLMISADNEQTQLANLDQTDSTSPEHQIDSDADELARTAGQLLDNVKHDQSAKFQQSNFLSLMRQLRDKEVRVDGDKIVDVSNPSPDPAIQHNHTGPAELITCRVLECDQDSSLM